MLDEELLSTSIHALSEEDLARIKPAARAILANRLERVWQSCEPHIDNGLGTGVDVRMAELGLRVLDRLAKLYEVTEPDRGGEVVPDRLVVTAARRAEVLAGLDRRAASLEA